MEFDSKFFKAVKENDIETVKKFLEVSAERIRRIEINVNIQDGGGNTPLIWAIRNGNHEIEKMLLDNGGVDLKLKDNYGNTEQDWIEMRGYVNILNSQMKGLDRNNLNEILNKNISILEKILQDILVRVGRGNLMFLRLPKSLS